MNMLGSDREFLARLRLTRTRTGPELTITLLYFHEVSGIKIRNKWKKKYLEKKNNKKAMINMEQMEKRMC